MPCVIVALDKSGVNGYIFLSFRRMMFMRRIN